MQNRSRDRADAARETIVGMLPALAESGLLNGASPKDTADAISVVDTLEQALAGADYVQENVAESVDVKREVFSALEAHTRPDTILASSTSALVPSSFTDHLTHRERCLVVHPLNPPYLIPALEAHTRPDTILASSTSALVPSSFTDHLTHRERCLVVHPLNPPYLIPAVDVVPSPWTSKEVIDRVSDLLVSCGQAPIPMDKEDPGFLTIRLQGAIYHEAFRLVSEGLASPEAVDVCIRDGLGLRWSFMGPFETGDLNAPGGIRDFVGRYGQSYDDMYPRGGPFPWTGDVLDKVEAARRDKLPMDEHRQRQAWRDRRLVALIAHKRAQAEAEASGGVRRRQALKIVRLAAAECKLPLPRPIRLGPVEITTRDFVALRIETDSGAFGDALGYPRGTALLASAERLAPLVLGQNVHRRRGITESLLSAFVNGRPTFVKAASLIDIALWDLASKAAGQPLMHLLGGARAQVPVMVVAGYYPDARPVEDICDEIRRRMDEGFERIKIMIRGDDAEADVRLVEAAWAPRGSGVGGRRASSERRCSLGVAQHRGGPADMPPDRPDRPALHRGPLRPEPVVPGPASSGEPGDTARNRRGSAGCTDHRGRTRGHHDPPARRDDLRRRDRRRRRCRNRRREGRQRSAARVPADPCPACRGTQPDRGGRTDPRRHRSLSDVRLAGGIAADRGRPPDHRSDARSGVSSELAGSGAPRRTVLQTPGAGFRLNWRAVERHAEQSWSAAL